MYQVCLPVDLDGVGFDIFNMKDPDYNIMLVFTCVQLVDKEG